MLTFAQIAAIIVLLSAFGVDPVTTADVQRILEGRPAITSSTTTTMAPAQPPVSPPSTTGNGARTTTDSSTARGTASAPTAAAPASKARIDVINYRPGSGLNRPHSTSPDFDQSGNPRNELDIGAVVYGEDGEPTRSAAVAVAVKSPTGEEASTMQGTGVVTPIYVNGQKNVVPVYTFHYEFRAAGEHTITFSSGGVSQSVTVQVGG